MESVVCERTLSKIKNRLTISFCDPQGRHRLCDRTSDVHIGRVGLRACSGIQPGVGLRRGAERGAAGAAAARAGGRHGRPERAPVSAVPGLHLWGQHCGYSRAQSAQQSTLAYTRLNFLRSTTKKRSDDLNNVRRNFDQLQPLFYLQLNNVCLQSSWANIRRR